MLRRVAGRHASFNGGGCPKEPALHYRSQPKKILVPVDLSESTPEILEYAAALARQSKAALDVVYVWEPPRFISPEVSLAAATWTLGDLEGSAVTQAQRELDAAVKAADLTQLRLRQWVEVGGTVPSILRVAERNQADLIVMGTHGRRGVERLLLGSVAQRIVAQAPCPVLTLRPRERS